MSLESCESHFPVVTRLATDNPYDAAVIRAELGLARDADVPAMVQKELFEIGQLATRSSLGHLKDEAIEALQKLYDATNLDDLVQRVKEDPKGFAAWARDKAKSLFRADIPVLRRVNDLFTFGAGMQVDVRAGWRDLRLGSLKFESTEPVDGKHLEEIVEVRGVAHLRLRDLPICTAGPEVREAVQRFYPSLTEEDEITLIFFTT